MYTSLTFDDISPYRVPASKMNALLDLMDKLQVHCTFFVIPSDHGYSHLKNKEFIGCLKRAIASGHELAQHGYTHHANNKYSLEFGNILSLPYPSYSIQRKRLEMGKKMFIELTGVEPLGFRAPGYFSSIITTSLLNSLNFLYDSSKTVFKPTYIGPPRVKILRKPLPFREHGVIQIPVTGDYTVKQKVPNLRRSLIRAIADFELFEKARGVFVVNNHPNCVKMEFLLQFLEEIVLRTKKKTKFVTLSEIERAYRLEGE
jgi:peptidoglycan/xylan/chitin deacetylase (PgdA/CDA1 family)